MNSISKVFLRDDKKIGIANQKGHYQWFDVSPETFGWVVYRVGTSAPEPMSQFSKEELLRYQYLLLNAYVFLHDSLEEGIKNNISKNDLDNYKSLILTIRRILKDYTNYIDQYDDLVKDYKDI